MGFEIDLGERLKKIFMEAIEDDEQYDDAFVRELEPDIEDQTEQDNLYGDDSNESHDWTGIPNAKAGKTLADLKDKRVKGPPMIMTNDGPIIADPLLSPNPDGKGYQRDVKLPHGGRVTRNMIDKMDPRLAKQYIPYTDVNDVESFKRVRGSIDREFLIDKDGEHWSFNEIVSALKPSIMSSANKINSVNGLRKEEAITPGMEAVMNSWMTDLGIAPFTTHVHDSIAVTMKDVASKSTLTSGHNTSKGGTRMPFSAQKNITSADAPLGGDESQGSFAGQIPGDDRLKGAEIEKTQNNQVELLHTLFNSSEVDLNKNEQRVMMATYGVNRQGNRIEPSSTATLARALSVSNVRVSQIRKSGLNKIVKYMQDNGYDSQEVAMVELGIMEAKLIAAAMIVIESMKDILNLELELLQEYQQIPIDVVIGSVVRHARAKVNSSTLSIDDVVAEGGESILGSTPNECISEAKIMTATKLSKAYYAETVAAIIQMHAVPVLAVIGGPEERSEEENVQKKTTE